MVLQEAEHGSILLFQKRIRSNASSTGHASGLTLQAADVWSACARASSRALRQPRGREERQCSQIRTLQTA